jgi:hypothetical protein
MQALLAAQELNDSMQSHLRLHFNSEEASDEQVGAPFHALQTDEQATARLLCAACGARQALTARKRCFMVNAVPEKNMDFLSRRLADYSQAAPKSVRSRHRQTCAS